MPSITYPLQVRSDLTNSLLCLALMHLARPEGPVGDRLTVTKEVFEAAYELQQRRCKAFDLHFSRWPHGAFTRELYTIWSILEEAGCQKPGEPSRSIQLTDKGRQWAKRVLAYLHEAEVTPIVEVLEKIAKDFQGLNTDQVLARHYAMRVRPLGWAEEVPMSNVPVDVPLTRALSVLEAKFVCVLPDILLQEFDIERLIGVVTDSADGHILTLHLENPLLRELIAAGIATQGEILTLQKAEIEERIAKLERQSTEH